MSTDAKIAVVFVGLAFVAAPVIIWAELQITRRRNRKAAMHRAAERSRALSDV